MSRTPTQSRVAHEVSSPSRPSSSRAGHPYSQQSRSQSTSHNLRSKHFRAREDDHPTDNNEGPPSQRHDGPTLRRRNQELTRSEPENQEAQPFVASLSENRLENRLAGVDDDEPYRASTRQLVEQLHSSQTSNAYEYDATNLGQGELAQQSPPDEAHDEMDWEWQTAASMNTVSMYASSDALSDDGTVRGSVSSFDGRMSVDPRDDAASSISSDFISSNLAARYDARFTTSHADSTVDDYDLKEDDGEGTVIPTAEDLIRAISKPTSNASDAEDEGESEVDSPGSSTQQRRCTYAIASILSLADFNDIATRYATRRSQATSQDRTPRSPTMLPTPRSSPPPQGSSSSRRSLRSSASQAAAPGPQPPQTSPFPSPVRRRRALAPPSEAPSTSRGTRNTSPQSDVQVKKHGSLRNSRSL